MSFVRSSRTGLNLAGAAKITVAEGLESGDVTGVNAAAAAWNAGFTPTKYVNNIQVSVDGLGTITVTYDTTPNGIPQLTQNGGGPLLTLSPNIGRFPLATGVAGPIDWACASGGQVTAGSEGLQVNAAGSVLPKQGGAHAVQVTDS